MEGSQVLGKGAKTLAHFFFGHSVKDEFNVNLLYTLFIEKQSQGTGQKNGLSLFVRVWVCLGGIFYSYNALHSAVAVADSRHHSPWCNKWN